mgnify:CR=1 FL=1
MRVEGIRVIENLLTQLNVTSYIYKPTNRRLGSVGVLNLLENNDINILLNSRAFDMTIENIGIMGFPNRNHLTAFINSEIGNLIIKTILSYTEIPSDVNVDKIIAQYKLGPTTPTGEKIKTREFKDLNKDIKNK